MNKKIIVLIFTTFFLLTGCANLRPQKISQTFAITILSPIMKINEVGFLHKNGSLNLQIYSSAVNVANIKIDEKICINQVCYDKIQFNREFFLKEHYDDFFAEILEAKPIYDEQNLNLNSCGFIQNISKYSIEYEVCGKNIKFIDTKNRIKIIIKELE